MNKTHVLIADGLGKEGLNKLSQQTHIQLSDKTGISTEDLKKELPEVDVLVVRSRTKVNTDLLSVAQKLKCVIRAGVGLDNIDIPTATEKAIAVMNAPTGNTITTAEHTLGMIFAISRKITQADSSMKKGLWEKKKFVGTQLSGQTIGIFGLGNIGREVAKRCLALGMTVLGSDPFMNQKRAQDLGVKLSNKEEIFAQADYITFHVPLTPETQYLINQNNIDQLKKQPYLINCSRGGVIEEAAIIDALEKNLIKGCALDVFEKEPIDPAHPILTHDQVALTPHLGASTTEAQNLVGLEVADQIINYTQSGVFQNAVNLPTVETTQYQKTQPYMKLLEKLGLFLAQTSSKEVSQLSLKFSGEISGDYHRFLTLAFLKGFFDRSISTPVSLVNVEPLAQQRGIRIEETFSPNCDDYQSLITATIQTKDTTQSVSGTLFGKEEERMTHINGIKIDATPKGSAILTQNNDTPGVVGKIGSFLGQNGINISRMSLGLNDKIATAYINIDSPCSEEVAKALQSLDEVISVKAIEMY